MKNFIKGPYIKYLPEIKVFELSKNDRYIVLATDGLWDELSPQDVAKVINQNDDNKDKIIDSLFRNALTHAAMDANMSLEQILKVEPGRKKRSLHDDITVMIVDLKNQYN
jgi:pyruvate dehydrogenase phosphatase